MKRGIQQTYVVIGGYGLLQVTAEPRRIVLMRGNKYGEEVERVLQNLPNDTPYETACKLADKHAKELGCRVGRMFNTREWAGEVEAVGEYKKDVK